VKHQAARILYSVSRRYPTQGRRLTAFVIAALGIARGNGKPEELHDLLERVHYFFGMEIPSGQIEHTFHEIQAFLKHRRIYEWHPLKLRKGLTPEERKLLSVLRSRESLSRTDKRSS
jgi:hypothetical protein